MLEMGDGKWEMDAQPTLHFGFSFPITHLHKKSLPKGRLFL